MTKRTQGFLLVVTLLVSAVVLLTVITTATVATLGARQTSASESHTFAALLAAESGVNALQAELSSGVTVFGEMLTSTHLTSVLENSGICTEGFDPCRRTVGAATVQLNWETPRVDPDSGRQVIGLASSAAIASTVTQRVLTDFEVRLVPRMNIRAPAALTSWPDTRIGGNATIEGAPAQADGTVVIGITSTASGFASDSGLSAGQTISVDVASTAAFRIGNYVRLAGSDGVARTFRVDGVESGALNVTSLEDVPGPFDVTAGSAVDLLPYAAAESVTLNGEFATEITVSDSSGFWVGERVTFQVDGQDYSPMVESVDGDVVTLSWAPNTAPLGVSIDEGLAFARDVKDVAANGTITVNGGGQACDPASTCVSGSDAGVNSPFSGTPDLFEQTFGIPYTSFSTNFPPDTSFSGDLQADSIIHIEGSYNLNGSSELCGGPGVLVVDGDLTVNGTCDEGFRGLIYVKGSYSQQGNSTISGAIVAEGVTEFGNASEDTSVTGTGQGDAKIEYDLAALIQAGRQLTPPTLAAVPGTYRRR